MVKRCFAQFPVDIVRHDIGRDSMLTECRHADNESLPDLCRKLFTHVWSLQWNEVRNVEGNLLELAFKQVNGLHFVLGRKVCGGQSWIPLHGLQIVFQQISDCGADVFRVVVHGMILRWLLIEERRRSYGSDPAHAICARHTVRLYILTAMGRICNVAMNLETQPMKRIIPPLVFPSCRCTRIRAVRPLDPGGAGYGLCTGRTACWRKIMGIV